MSLDSLRARRLLESLPALAEAGARLAPDLSPLPPRIANSADTSPAALERRWQQLPAAAQAARSTLCPAASSDLAAACARNIENLIGFATLPIGLAGPLRVRGLHASGDYYIPLATTEAALVASYNRGAHAISEAGGCAAVLLNEGVTRSPGFVFADVRDCGRFAAWVVTQTEQLRAVAATTTRHGRLEDVRLAIEGDHLYLHLDYSTGDAAGQNMVTLAKSQFGDALSPDPAAILRMATSNIRPLLGGDHPGALEVGLPATFVVLNFHAPHLRHTRHITASVVTRVTPEDVLATYRLGRPLHRSPDF